MNDQPEHAAEDAIIDKILSDGRMQAERTLKGARHSAESERHKAEAEADKLRKQVLERAKHRASTVRSKELATGHIEAKRMALNAREKAVGKVFDIIRGELANFRQNREQYKRSLHNLAVEAIRAVDEAEVTLKVGKADQDIADEDFIARVADEVTSSRQGKVMVEVAADAGLTDGGCVAVSKRGRIVFDNTFGRRLERMRPALRAMIVSEVLKSNV